MVKVHSYVQSITHTWINHGNPQRNILRIAELQVHLVYFVVVELFFVLFFVNFR